LARIEEAVAAQNMSPDEVQRMNHERETLTRNLDDLRVKISEASSQAYDAEMQLTKSMDRFDVLVSDYTNIAHQIGTIPLLADGPGFALGPDGVDYNVDIDLGVEDVNELISEGKKLRSVIWPGLQAFGEKFRAETMELDNQKIVLEDELDRKMHEVEAMRDEAETRHAKYTMLNDKAEDAKQVSGLWRPVCSMVLIG
jgi:kinetochore protein NDC80